VTEPEILQDTEHRPVVRIGDTVRRPLHPWSASVHALLRHLEQVDFPHAPRFLGIDDEGREVLTYLDGESGPAGWARVVDEDGLVAAAHLLRDYHEAVRSYRPSLTWATSAGAPAGDEVICHGDFAPWNLVWRGTTPVGILDWDYAWPAPPLHDVAYALEYVAPFRDDATCLRWLAYPSPPDRRRRLARFAAAYGIDETAGLVDAVIEQQETVLARARQLAAAGRQPQAAWQESGFLDESAERVRWSRANRELFDRPPSPADHLDLSPDVSTPRRARHAMTDAIDTADRIEPTLSTEPMEPIEANEPTEPMDRAEPVEPMDSTEPLDQRLRTDFSER
jgi:hypothetical protein